MAKINMIGSSIDESISDAVKRRSARMHQFSFRIEKENYDKAKALAEEKTKELGVRVTATDIIRKSLELFLLQVENSKK